MKKQRPNWLHLDLKGIIPDPSKMLEWIDLFAGAGFSGIIWEYEDRLPWKTWPGVFRSGYELDQWREIWRRCEDRGLDVMPLIQTQGHLEWILKHGQWSHWRENGCLNELCPQEEEVLPALRAWMDEVSALHPNAGYLHIGGDETWNLATCPRCRAVAAKHSEGRMGVYMDHLRQLTRMALDRNLRPVIWADMFWRENRTDLAARLPPQTVLVDWQYQGRGPWETIKKLGESGREIWGASAVRCMHDLRLALPPLGKRSENVLGWHGQDETVSTLIHTTWGRARSLMPLYGPWEGWLPVFLLAGDPAKAGGGELAGWIPRLDTAMSGDENAALQLEEELGGGSFGEPMYDACREWWRLVLRHRRIYLTARQLHFTCEQLEVVKRHVGVDPAVIDDCRAKRKNLMRQLESWEQCAHAFFIGRGLSDANEYIASRSTVLHKILNADRIES